MPMTPNPAVDLAPFGRWTLRNEAPQRRSPPRLGVMIKRALSVIVLTLAGFGTFSAVAKTPDCTGTNRWPAMSTSVGLFEAGLVERNQIDASKTKVIRLASEKIGNDLYRQIHQITFYKKTGESIEVITSNEVSSEECSVSAVKVFVVSRHLDD